MATNGKLLMSPRRTLASKLYVNPRAAYFPIKWKLKKESFMCWNENCDRQDLVSKTFVLVQDSNCLISISLRCENKIYVVELEAAESFGAELIYAFSVSARNVFCFTRTQYEKFQFPLENFTQQMVGSVFQSLGNNQSLVLYCLAKLELNTESYSGLCGLKEISESIFYPKASPVKNPVPHATLEDKLIENFMLHGEIPVLNAKLAVRLAYRSHTKNVDELIAICTQHLLHNMTENYLVEVLYLAGFLKIDELIKKCENLKHGFL